MKVLIQRVNSASVRVDGKIVGEIRKGLLVFAGFGRNDQEECVEKMVRKLVQMRIFPGKKPMDASLLDVKGDLLIISQFTLYADTRQGRRPSFTDAAAPDIAENLYQLTIECAKQYGIKVETGKFAAKMEVELINAGPVTFMLSDEN